MKFCQEVVCVVGGGPWDDSGSERTKKKANQLPQLCLNFCVCQNNILVSLSFNIYYTMKVEVRSMT